MSDFMQQLFIFLLLITKIDCRAIYLFQVLEKQNLRETFSFWSMQYLFKIKNNNDLL